MWRLSSALPGSCWPPCCLLPTSSSTELPSEVNFVFSWGRVPVGVP